MHEIDECRFDVGVFDCVWYLRASSAEECVRWVTKLQEYKNLYRIPMNSSENQSTTSSSLFSSNNNNSNHQNFLSIGGLSNISGLSLSSATSTLNQSNSVSSGYGENLCRYESAMSLSSITSCRSYKEQILEIEAFRSVLLQQIKTLQHYFDSSLQSTNLINEHLKRHRRHQSMNGKMIVCCS